MFKWIMTRSWALEHRCIFFFFLSFLGCILYHNQVNAGFKHIDQHCDSMLIVHSLKFWWSVSHLVVCWSFNSWEWKPQADTIQCGVLSDVSCYIVALAPSINTHSTNKKIKNRNPKGHRGDTQMYYYENLASIIFLQTLSNLGLQPA